LMGDDVFFRKVFDFNYGIGNACYSLLDSGCWMLDDQNSILAA